MVKLNRKIEYAVRALRYLSNVSPRVASVREMANECHIPEALLSKIMQKVRKPGWVSSTHGNRGGYKLDRPPESISLWDLSEVLSDRSVQKPSPALQRFEERLSGLLRNTSLLALWEA